MPRSIRQVQRPPTLRVFTELGLGSRTYKYNKQPLVTSGFGDPPPGFIIVSTSLSEWMVYWALSKIYGLPVDPRQGPFIGAPGIWGYQVPAMGGRAVGGAVVDFTVQDTRSGIPIGIRIQTELWHLFTANRKQASDLLQRQRLMEDMTIVDVYDYQYTGDKTGQQVIQVMKAAIGAIEIPDPLRGATARRNPRTGIGA